MYKKIGIKIVYICIVNNNTLKIFPNQIIISTSTHQDEVIEDSYISLWNKLNIVCHTQFKEYIQNNEDVLVYGDFFSFENPEYNNCEIFENINWKKPLDDVLLEINKLGGYFIIIIKQKNGFVIVNDASGQYECFYYQNAEDFTVSNQPHYILNYLNLKNNDWCVPGYISKNKNVILNITPIDKLYKLTPNHYYSTFSQKMIRFFPLKKIKRKSVKVNASVCQIKLSRSLISMSKRRRLAIGLTAGWDSRLILACCRDIIEKVDLYTVNYYNEASRIDIDIAQKLSNIANKDLYIIDSKKTSPESIQKGSTYHEGSSTHLSSTNLGRRKFDSHYIINGNVSEIGRNYYQPVPKILNASDLAYMSSFNEGEFENLIFQNWLNDVKPIEKLGYNISDFLYWEHKMPNWAGREKSVTNLYQINISPFNNRNILNHILEVPSKKRDKHFNKLYYTIVENVWAELNTIPYNPDPKSNKIKKMKKLGLYLPYRYLYFKMRKLKF